MCWELSSMCEEKLRVTRFCVLWSPVAVARDAGQELSPDVFILPRNLLYGSRLLPCVRKLSGS